MANTLDSVDYNLDVVKAGDKASGNFKAKCDAAIEKIPVRRFLNTDGKIREIQTGINKIEKVIESIDGVGTKVQIYTNVFNSLINENADGLISDNELLERSIELWERMLHDLIAMNVDDLRNGEMAVAVTNIIDINHLNGVRGKVFSDSMGQALYNVIKELDIAMTAGETAILGDPQKVAKIAKLFNNQYQQLADMMNDRDIFTFEHKDLIFNILNQNNSILEVILEDIEFNIGGTGLGIVGEKERKSTILDKNGRPFIIGNKEKLVELKPGQSIVYFQEKPTENGIIGPRANGITRVRDGMESLVGEGWETITFEQFLEAIGKEESVKIPQRLKDECAGLKMWDIATGKTTVFNPFISRKLLGGIDSNPIAKVSSVIHVTGNPGRKISEGLKGRDDLYVDLDISDVKIPQIIEILQILGEITDEDAMGSWNMGIPYVVVCENSDVDKIIKEAENNGFIADKIGEVKEREDENIIGNIKGVGIGNGEILLEKEEE